MYGIGDLIVYEGSNCVCRIDGITKLDIEGADKNRLYYVLKPLRQDCVIYNPVDNETAFMRPVITKDEAERLIDAIPEMKAMEINSRSEETNRFLEVREIAMQYEVIIKTRDCAKLLELTKSIYEKKQFLTEHNRKFGSVEATAMKRAEDMLFDEMSVALGIPKEGVQKYIEESVNKKIKN